MTCLMRFSGSGGCVFSCLFSASDAVTIVLLPVDDAGRGMGTHRPSFFSGHDGAQNLERAQFGPRHREPTDKHNGRLIVMTPG